MKKKIISAFLCLAMIGSLLAGCGSSSSGSAETTAAAGGEETAAAAAEAPAEGDIKIGVSIWSSTDVLGSQCKLILDEAAKALGVQIQYVDQGHVSEKVTASVEQLCAAGC